MITHISTPYVCHHLSAAGLALYAVIENDLPPTSHTLNLVFLYVTVSTLKPTVGMVVTSVSSFSLYRIAVDHRQHVSLSPPSSRLLLLDMAALRLLFTSDISKV